MKRPAMTLAEVLVVLVILSLVTLLAVQMVLTADRLIERQNERRHLESSLHIGLDQIEADARRACGVVTRATGNKGEPELLSEKITFMMFYPQTGGDGLNGPAFVTYGLKEDNQKDYPSDAPKSRQVLYRKEWAESLWNNAGDMEPVVRYLSRSPLGLQVQAFDDAGAVTKNPDQAVALEVTLSGELTNGQMLSETKWMPLGGMQP